MFVDFLISTVCFDWAKCKVGVHQLSVLEQVLESDDVFLKGVCILEFDGPIKYGTRILVNMRVDNGVCFLPGDIGRLTGGNGLACFLLLFGRTTRLAVLTALSLA